VDSAPEDVDFKLTDLDDGRERDRVAVGPPQEGDDPGEQLFGRKRYGQDDPS
jgi:hypothetical protein